MQPVSYSRHRFPPELIRHGVWLYLRFTLSYRDVEELLVAQTVPFAGAVVVGSESKWRDLFTVSYIAVIGLLLSLIAGLDDLTDFIGISVDALQY